MDNLFAYGTLMCKEIMAEVAGECPEPVPAVLPNYARRGVRGERFPAILPHRNGRVEGVVYRSLRPNAWEKLDRYEGEMYSRQRVSVRLQDGTFIAAAAYVVRPEYRRRLGPTDWDFDDFLKNRKAQFRRLIRGGSG